jgi:PPOX class probable F420-dependent enzyme
MPELDARFRGKYVSLTSFKRDGTGVATPVWFVVEDGRVLVQTDGESFKVRRIRRNPHVTLAPCSASGRTRAPAVSATAEILPAGELEHVRGLVGRKYRIDRIFILPIYWAVQRLRGRATNGTEVALAITPN